jgi:signal transduction histidine kinase
MNLIQNSIKFSKEDQVIHITVDRETSMDQGELIGVCISVTDYGIGITKNDRENLFKPYYKAKDVKNREMNP